MVHYVQDADWSHPSSPSTEPQHHHTVTMPTVKASSEETKREQQKTLMWADSIAATEKLDEEKRPSLKALHPLFSAEGVLFPRTSCSMSPGREAISE